jgi:hypothetical protein
MDEQSGLFNEVLSISVNTEGFAADLSKLESLWSQSLDRMAEKAQDSALDPNQLIPVAALQSLQDSLTELSARVNETTSSIADDFATMTTSVSAELEEMNAAAAKTRESLQAVANTGGSSPTKRGARRASIFGVDQDAGLMGNFMNGLTLGGQGANGIAALAGYMTTMSTIGAGLYAVINGITEIITAIPHALMQGVHYLETFQQNSSDLQGVLASNVKFSSDFATNFRITGEAAEYAVSHLRDNAVKDNLDPKQLQNSFKSLVDSGGGAMVKDTSELVDLTTQFALAMKAAGKSSEGTRALVSEIPKLMSGTEGPSSKLLQTLDLTKNQWEGIREQALAHKNLLELLAPSFAPYVAQVKAAQTNHEELTKRLDRQKDVIESAFAVPVVKEFDGLLSDTVAYLDKNKNSIELMANVAGQLVDKILEVGSAFLHMGGDGHGALTAVADVMGAFIVLIDATKQNLLAAGNAAENFWKVLQAPLGHTKEAMQAAWADMKSFNKDLNADLKATVDQVNATIDAISTGKMKATDAESGGKNHAFSGGRVPLPSDNSKAELAAMRQEFADQMDVLKTNYDGLINLEHQAQAEQTETAAQGARNRIDIRKEEISAIEQLLQGLRAKYGNVKGADKVLDGMQNMVDSMKREFDKQDSADNTAATKQVQQVDQEKYATQQKMAEEHYKVMGEIFKRSAQEGLMSYEDAAKSEIQLQIQLYTQARNALLAQRAASGFVEGTPGYQKYTDDLNLMDASQKDQRSQDSRNLTQGSLKDSHAELQAATAKANLDMDYAKTVQDGAARQKAVNAALAERLKADEDYLAAVRAANPKDRSIPELQARVGQDKAAQLSEYNDSHVFQKQLDSSGNMQGAGFFSDLEQGSNKLSQAFSLLEETTMKLMNSQNNSLQKVGAGAEGISGLAKEGGNALQGVGGMLGSIGSALPGIGAAVGVVGGIVSMIGNMFAAQAKNIANDIQKKFDNILQNFQNNSATFAQTMQALQEEQQNAIQQLSGVKGGSGYLAEILLQVQQTEAALNAQALAGRDQMGILTAAAKQSTQVGQQWMTTWAQIEQQVKNYLDKDGGNTALATAYQNAELAQQAKQLQDQINAGLQQAVQDNYQLNSLMMSRQQIQLSILQLENQMSDSIERRQAPALGLAAAQTKLQLQQLQQQLSDTNNQIDIEQQKVTAENSLFGLTTDINALHAEDAKLQMAALTEQLANYKEMLAIAKEISGLQANPNTGYFNGTSPFNPAQLPGGLPGFGATGSPTAPVQAPIAIHGPITITVHGGNGNGSDVARGIATELNNCRRFGVSL